MQIELHIPSGLLIAVAGKTKYHQYGYYGCGHLAAAIPTTECIPHSIMCGPFSRDHRIAQQAVILGNATATRGSADYWATRYTSKYGLIKPCA